MINLRITYVSTALAAALIVGFGFPDARADVTTRNLNWDESRSFAGVQVDEYPHVAIDGEITADMVDDFEASISEVLGVNPLNSMGGTPMPIVTLNSPGGDVLAAMRIGRIVRSHAAQTFVMPGRECSSACVLVFVGGVFRMVTDDAIIGLHRPSFSDFESFARLDQASATAEYSKVLAEIDQYFHEMGISNEFAKAFLGTRSSNISYIGATEADELGLSGVDPAFQEWDNAKFRASVSDSEYRAWTEYNNCMDSCATGECQQACRYEP